MKVRWKSDAFKRNIANKTAKTQRGCALHKAKSIYELTTSTRNLILEQLKIGCSRCGWNEEKCDFHHISGRNIEDEHTHVNLSYLCPNCHRIAHNRDIQLTTFEMQVGDKWKNIIFPSIM